MEIAFRQITDIFTALKCFQFCKGQFTVTVCVNNRLCGICIFINFRCTAYDLVTDFFKFFLCIFAVFFICRLLQYCAVGFYQFGHKSVILNNIVLAVNCRNINSTDNQIRTDTRITCTAHCKAVKTFFGQFSLLSCEPCIGKSLGKFNFGQTICCYTLGIFCCFIFHCYDVHRKNRQQH